MQRENSVKLVAELAPCNKAILTRRRFWSALTNWKDPATQGTQSQ